MATPPTRPTRISRAGQIARTVTGRPGRDRSARHSASRGGGTIEDLLASREIVVACGPGGVGKTTAAAALAVTAAVEHGGKVLVLTVDPARRLADALGLVGIGNDERRVPADAFKEAGLTPKGELWVSMLDTRASWDALIRRHAPDARTRNQILSNPLYRNITGRFVQSHDYIAMERLYEIHATGTYDLIVVDTPPTRNALDFLDAPDRLAEFFSSRLLRWLIVPYRSRLVNVASKPFYQVADRILGTQFLADIAEFFILFQTMYDGFVERAEAVSHLLADRRTTFMVVSTLETVPLREAEIFAHELTARHLHLGAIILNKVLPDFLRDPKAAKAADAMKARTEELADALVPELVSAGSASSTPASGKSTTAATSGKTASAKPNAAGSGSGGAAAAGTMRRTAASANTAAESTASVSTTGGPATGAKARENGSSSSALSDPMQVGRVLAEIAGSFSNYRVVARREAEERAELATSPEVLVSVPYFETDIVDLAGLITLGRQIWTA